MTSMFSDSRHNGEPLDNQRADSSSSAEQESQPALDERQSHLEPQKHQADRNLPPANPLIEAKKHLLEEDWIKQEGLLVERVMHGDPEALAKLYETYVSMVYGYSFKRVKNETDAQSLTSDIFTRAIESLLQGRYTPQGKPFGAWLSGIAHNVYFEWRRAQFSRYAMIPFEDLRADQHMSTGEDVLEALIRQEQESLGWSLVRELPLIEQQILILRHQYHLSHAEIARRLHLTESACKQRHYRAKQTLKKKLSQFEDWNQSSEN